MYHAHWHSLFPLLLTEHTFAAQQYDRVACVVEMPTDNLETGRQVVSQVQMPGERGGGGGGHSVKERVGGGVVEGAGKPIQ